ncbi:MAG: GldG family protein [Bacillota bacterium]|nr:GldG family protein [Bacillota bacterium]
MKKISIKESFKDKKFRYGGYATLITAVVIAIIIVINLLAAQLNWKLDLTPNQLYSLSDQSKTILGTVKDDVKIIGFYESGKESQQVKTILSKYQAANSHIKVSYVDPDKYPQVAQQYTSSGSSTGVSIGSVVVQKGMDYKAGTKFKIISENDMVGGTTDATTGETTASQLLVEQKVTGAITYVTSEKSTIIYTLQGHNETALDTTLASQLDNENYTVQNLNLASADAKLEAGSVLLVIGPKSDFTPGETDKVKTFMSNGGRAVFLLDYSETATPNIKGILNSYGVDIKPTIIIEGDTSHIASTQYPNIIIPTLGDHEILKPITSANTAILIPNAQSIVPFTPKKNTTKIENLLTTSDSSWGKKNVKSTTISKETGDYTGPFIIADAITDSLGTGDTSKDSKLIVVGSSTFTNSQILSAGQGNKDFFMNSVNWLVDKKDNITVRAKDLKSETLNMTASQELAVAAIVVVVIPVIILFSGVLVWLRRRHR